MKPQKQLFIWDKIDDLIKKATKSELAFANILQKFELHYKFQYPIENKKEERVYIIDFYVEFYKRKYVFEIDGGYHNNPEQIEKDKKRDAYLKSKNITVYRVLNEEVFYEKSKIYLLLQSIFINPVFNFKKKKSKMSKKEKKSFYANKQTKNQVTSPKKYYKSGKVKNARPAKTEHPNLDKLIEQKKLREEKRAKTRLNAIN